MSGDDTLKALREALAHSPDNVVLRRHLAQTLMGMARFEEAIAEYREALRRAPKDEDLLLGLAGAYLARDKRSEALVILEQVIRSSPKPARAYLLHARLLRQEGETERAVREYRKAVDADPSVADSELAAQLGIGRDPSEPWEVVDGRVRETPGDEPGSIPDLRIEKPDRDFRSVGGLESVKEEIRMKIINPLLHPELYQAYGKKVGGGILLYGPPGCGKTHLARATAGEIKSAFLSVGIHDVLEMWIGASERNLHDVFEQARRARPCVLFFDEVDALGASRTDMRGAAGRHVINQFLSELDGIGTDNEGLLILAATNAPWHLDGAFRRPGRFDRIIFVPPPDPPAREAILEVLLRGRPSKDVDFAEVAKKTERFSGADLKGVVDVAVEEKLKEAMKKGLPLPIVTRDLVAAAKKVKPSTRDWFATARNYTLYSNEGGLYDDVKPWLDLK
jgi:transitional endoplasmic reticulum ATPase